jgi:hypothetical protein
MEEGDYRSIYDLKLHEEWQGVMKWGIRYKDVYTKLLTDL